MKNDKYIDDIIKSMNIKERILTLNKEYINEAADIDDLFLTVITNYQLYEPCNYLSEDEEWLNVIIFSLDDPEISQALSIKKSEITTFGLFNRNALELDISLQKGSEDLYQ